MKKKGFILIEIIMIISILSIIIPISFKYIRGVNDKTMARDTKIHKAKYLQAIIILVTDYKLIYKEKWI